jgi:hypothetical protein
MSLGQCVVAEAGCNWYLYDINIYSLSKKMILQTFLLSLVAVIWNWWFLFYEMEPEHEPFSSKKYYKHFFYITFSSLNTYWISRGYSHTCLLKQNMAPTPCTTIKHSAHQWQFLILLQFFLISPCDPVSGMMLAMFTMDCARCTSSSYALMSAVVSALLVSRIPVGAEKGPCRPFCDLSFS